MDLMGYGKSGDIPSGSYGIPVQARYLDAWFEATDLGNNIHLVLHDWGGPLGFDWGYRNQARVKSITYMETLITPLSMISGNSILKQNLGQVSIIFQ